MDDLSAKHRGHQNITPSCKTLDFYLKLFLLLESVKHTHSLMQHCPMTTGVCVFPNFTSEAGSPFSFKLPIRATPGHTHYQLSLTDADSTLPHWMVFRRQTSSLSGLALSEDCGLYHLKVSVIGEQHAAHFYLHILNRTMTDSASRDSLPCSEGEMTTWANLLLQLNPATLDASQRIRLVSIMADYLRLPLGSVYLFSSIKSFIQQQEKLEVCKQSGLVEKSTEKQGGSADVAQLLWRVGCQSKERQSDLAKVLEHSVTAGGLARLLEAPVLGWRALCVSRMVQHKVKRDLQRLKLTPTPNMIVPPPTQIHQTMKLEHSHICSLPLSKLEPSLSTILWHMNHRQTRLEPAYAEDQTENNVMSVGKGFLLQSSDTQADSPERLFEFTSERNILKTNHMQEIQVSSDSLFSIKQTNLYPYSKDVNTLLERRVFTSKMIWTTLHTSLNVYFGRSHPNWFSDHNSQELFKQTGLSTSKMNIEATGCSEQVSEVAPDTSLSLSDHFWITELFHLPFLPEHISPVRTFAGEPSTVHSIYPSLPLTPDSHSVTSMLTHEVVDRKSLTTRLTLRPHPKETPLWTGAYRGSETDSESPPTVSSLGQTVDNQESIKDHHCTKPTLYNFPSVSHPPQAENYNDVLLPTSRSKTTQSPPPSNKIPATQLFPDVSPTSYLTTEQLSITQRSIQHLSSVLNQDVTSQQNETTQDVSSTTLTGLLTPSGETELESSLSTSLLEPSVMTSTPALPSGFFGGQLETSSVINPVFAAEYLKSSSSMMPQLQTSSKSLPHDTSVPVLKSGTELCFNQNKQMQTLSSGISLMPLQPTYPSWPPQMSLRLTKTRHIISVPLSVFTLHTLLLGETQKIDKFSHISLDTGMTTSMYLNTAVLITFAPGSSVTYPAPSLIFESTRLVSEHHFDPTTPSAVQEPHTTSFIHQIQTLDPSLPLCGQPVAHDHEFVNGCTTQVKRESTVEHILDIYSQDEKSLFLSFNSSGQFFSTLALNPAMHLSARTTTATAQNNISDTHPSLEDSGLSVITHTSLAPNTSALSVSIENSLLIHQTDSSGPITKGRPTQQILSTSPSPFYGMSTTLLTSLQASSSASISRSMNLPPKAMQSIPMLMATVGFPFHYSIPPKTFLDPEDGEADALSLEIRLIDGPHISAGTWLALDGLELHGVPLEVDLQFAPQHLLLAARDRQGLSTWLPLTLDLRHSPVDPCHVFTLTAQRSLYSILRHRHKVELLLRKLSRFFNSSSYHHLSVVSMRPGSTVVSWYNYSLCGMGHSRVRQCYVDQIQSMWLAMRSADGSVSPAFRDSMLPEFPVTKVGPVSYRKDCFFTTSTPIFNGSNPGVQTTLTPSLGTNTCLNSTSNICVSVSPAITATSHQNYYHWMAGMFTALFVVCLLILIVLLVAAVLYFCKGSRRSRTVAIWPASTVLSVQSRDLRAIRPRRPPLFQPELPPPPLRLWINLSQGDEGPSACEHGTKSLDKALRPRPPH